MMTDGFSMGFGGGWMWLFWIISIVLTVWAVKSAIGIGNSSRDKGGSALDILKERYAKGEIDQKEFEKKRAAIND